MPEQFFRFLTILNSQFLPEPSRQAFSQTFRSASADKSDHLPEEFEDIARGLQELEMRAPFQAAVLQLRAMLLVWKNIRNSENLEQLEPEDFDNMLELVSHLDTLSRNYERVLTHDMPETRPKNFPYSM